MVQLLDNLKWMWVDISEEGRSLFLNTMNAIDLIIKRNYDSLNEEIEDNHLNVYSFGRQNYFLVNPAVGEIDYFFRDFKGFDEKTFYSYFGKQKINSNQNLLNRTYLKLEDSSKRFYFLNKPLVRYKQITF